MKRPLPRSRRSTTLATTLAATLMLALAPLAAGAGPAGDTDLAGVGSIEVLAGWRQADGSHMAALRIRLKPGWKTYWRAPGDAGIPPQFDWSGSRNIAAARLFWPRPEVATTNGMRSIVYHGEVVIPIRFTPKTADSPMEMRARVSLGVCKAVCVPVSARFDVVLPVSQTTPEAAIARALAARPESAKKAGVRRVTCTVAPIRDGLRITATIDMPPLGRDEIAILEGPDPSIWVSEPVTRRQGRLLSASADMVAASGAPFALDPAGVRITVLGQDGAVDIQGCPAG